MLVLVLLILIYAAKLRRYLASTRIDPFAANASMNRDPDER